MKKPYTIGEENGQQFIECRACKRRSFHRLDIEYRYCSNCHKFHDQIPMGRTHATR